MASFVENERPCKLSIQIRPLEVCKKTEFTNLVKNEVSRLRSIKAQFGLLVKFSINRNGETQHMEHFFKQRDPAIFNRNNEATIEDTFNRFADQAKGEIEAWSKRGSGWVIDGISAAFVNLA